MEWEEPAIISTDYQCEEILFNNNTLFCGKHGTKKVRRRGNVGGGVMEEATVIPCMDCDDLLAWSAWGPCMDQGRVIEGMKCRQRGNNMLGLEEEKATTGTLHIHMISRSERTPARGALYTNYLTLLTAQIL